MGAPIERGPYYASQRATVLAFYSSSHFIGSLWRSLACFRVLWRSLGLSLAFVNSQTSEQTSVQTHTHTHAVPGARFLDDSGAIGSSLESFNDGTRLYNGHTSTLTLPLTHTNTIIISNSNLQIQIFSYCSAAIS